MFLLRLNPYLSMGSFEVLDQSSSQKPRVDNEQRLCLLLSTGLAKQSYIVPLKTEMLFNGWADLEILGQSSWEKSKMDNEEQGDFLIIYRFLAEKSY